MNLDLSNIEQRQVHQAMADIQTALDDISVPMREVVLPVLSAREYDVLRSYLGTIRNAHDQLCELFYNEAVRERDETDEALVQRALGLAIAARPNWLDPANVAVLQAPGEYVERDQASPHGIERPQS